MADDVVLSAGTADGARIKTDEDGNSDHWQYVKLAFGADNTQTIVGSISSNPLPVALSATDNAVLDVIASGYNAEDAVAGSGDIGVMALAVRSDTLAPDAADGDYHSLLTDELGALWVHEEPNLVDSNNSTASTLIADAVFTGTGTDILSYSAVTVQLDASHDSATDGLQFQFSIDDTNWDVTHDYTYVATNGGVEYSFAAHSQFFRVVYTNGGTGQTHFRMETLLHHDSPISNTHRLANSEHPNQDALLVKGAMLAQVAGSGDFVPIQSTTGNNLKVSVEEISDGLDIGAGNAGTETQRMSISTDDVNMSAIKTATETVAAAVSTQMQVDIVADGAGLLTGTVHDAAFGTAGSADAQVRSVQGVASMTPLLVDATGSGDIPVTLDSEAVVLGAGSAAFGKLSANDGVDIGDVDVTSISAGANLVGDVGLSGARTAGGTTIFRSIDLDEGTLEVVKASAGQIYWIHCMNLSAATKFVKIYNATSGTYGTGTPVLTFPVATQGDTNGAGFMLSVPNGIAFATGISIGAGTGIADNDTGAPGANEVVVNVGFAEC